MSTTGIKAEADAPSLPNRRELRAALLEFSQKNTLTALRLVIFDYALFAAGLCVVAAPGGWFWKFLASLLIWIQIARLFIIGHDACHQSLTPDRKLNKWLGRLAFLPSLTPFKLWELGHNMAHHGFSNLRGKDYVWAPYSPEEFAQLPPWRKTLERVYRSGFGCGLYYFVELWWRKLFFPSRREVGGSRSLFMGDCLLVSSFGLAWIAGLMAAAQATAQSSVLLLFFGFLLPFILWNTLMGFVIYVHHTDPDVQWFNDGNTWAQAQPHLTATIHVQFPSVFGSLLHNIMEHPAHHLDMTIPLYQLPAAQKRLDMLVPDRILKRQFSWTGYRRACQACQLFDYDAGIWVPFLFHSNGSSSRTSDNLSFIGNREG